MFKGFCFQINIGRDTPDPENEKERNVENTFAEVIPYKSEKTRKLGCGKTFGRYYVYTKILMLTIIYLIKRFHAFMHLCVFLRWFHDHSGQR